ncbi:TPA: hypothetical protein R8G83_004170 [Citrobacter youngae]|nr:hypothetical protein [Citrobacter youngae]HEF0092489.1 hypothetical protein [Citrobacter youngae]
MTSREQFEEWCINRLISVTRMVGCDSYQSWRTRELWSAWQASRAEVEIMMPEPFQMANSTSGLSYYYEKEVDDALRQAGIKVKDC